MTESTLVIDRRGEVKECSASLARLVGRRSEQLVGRQVWTLLPGWTPFGKGLAAHELRLMVAGHASIPVRVSCTTVHLEGETLYVTEVRRCKEPLRR
jgi:PAS domain-containing protein